MGKMARARRPGPWPTAQRSKDHARQGLICMTSPLEVIPTTFFANSETPSKPALPATISATSAFCWRNKLLRDELWSRSGLLLLDLLQPLVHFREILVDLVQPLHDLRVRSNLLAPGRIAGGRR